MPFTITMPKLSPTMEDGSIARWHKKVGDKVNEGEVLFEVATDKASVEYYSPESGFLRKIIVKEGANAKINQPVAILTKTTTESIEGYEPKEEAPKEEVKKEKAPEKKAEPTPTVVEAPRTSPKVVFKPEPPMKSEPKEGVKASPLARRLAKEKGIELAQVKGSGPGGRITSTDLDLTKPDLITAFGPKEPPTIPAGSYHEEPMTQIRKVIASRLQASKMSIPHFYIEHEVVADSLNDLRNQLKDGGFKFTFNDFVIRAAALALRKHPIINSGFNDETSNIIRFETVDISVAVTIESGLITPIIRHADYKTLAEISEEVKVLAKKAKEGKLQREEYAGGSFTVSNMGMYGTDRFSAVINPPQAAILAVGAIKDRAIVKEGKLVAGKTFSLVLSVDHRVIDGSVAAEFMKTLQFLLEKPSLLLV